MVIMELILKKDYCGLKQCLEQKPEYLLFLKTTDLKISPTLTFNGIYDKIECLKLIFYNKDVLAIVLGVMQQLKITLLDDEALKWFEYFMGTSNYNDEEAMCGIANIIGEERFFRIRDGKNPFLDIAYCFNYELVAWFLKKIDHQMTDTKERALLAENYLSQIVRNELKYDLRSRFRKPHELQKVFNTTLLPAIILFLKDTKLDVGCRFVLHEAVRKRNLALFKFLITHACVDINEYDESGFTALDEVNAALLGYKFYHVEITEQCPFKTLCPRDFLSVRDLESPENIAVFKEMKAVLAHLTIDHNPDHNPKLASPMTDYNVTEYKAIASVIQTSLSNRRDFVAKRAARLKVLARLALEGVDPINLATINHQKQLLWRHQKQLLWELMFFHQNQFICKIIKRGKTHSEQIGNSVIKFYDAREDDDYQFLVHTTCSKYEQLSNTLASQNSFIRDTLYFSTSVIDKNTPCAVMSHQNRILFPLSIIIESRPNCILKAFPRDIASPRMNTTLYCGAQEEHKIKQEVASAGRQFIKRMQTINQVFNEREALLMGLQKTSSSYVNKLVMDLQLNADVVFSILEGGTSKSELMQEYNKRMDGKDQNPFGFVPEYTPHRCLRKTESHYNEVMVSGAPQNKIKGIIVEEANLLEYKRSLESKQSLECNQSLESKQSQEHMMYQAEVDKSIQCLVSSKLPLILVNTNRNGFLEKINVVDCLYTIESDYKKEYERFSKLTTQFKMLNIQRHDLIKSSVEKLKSMENEMMKIMELLEGKPLIDTKFNTKSNCTNLSQ